MKYSIIMPFYNKERELRITLDSFLHHYKDRKDFEIIIVEDPKNKQWMEFSIGILNEYSPFLNIKHIVDYKINNGHNPAKLFNRGVEEAKGQYIVLTNPECAHKSDILSGLDVEFMRDENQYIICACKNVEINDSYFINRNRSENDDNNFLELKYKDLAWYQHSKYRNQCYHFCSAISSNNYDKVGGFDENYSLGIAYDDDDFRDSVINAGIQFSVKDDLLILHINHDFSFKLDNYEELVEKNKNYYLKKRCTKSRMKLGIGIPLTDDKVHKEFFDTWVTMEKPSNFVYLRPIFHGHIDEIRNQITQQAIQSGCTHLIMFDTDQTYDPQTLTKLLSHDKDVVGAMVCKRYKPYNPLLMRGTLGKYRYVSDEEIEDGGLVEVDATGTGCILFKTKVFFDIPYPWFEMARTDEGKPAGEDVYFCHKLKEAGYDIFVDTSIKIGHLCLQEVTYDFYKFNKILQEKKDEKNREGEI